jgi:TetR/AcrR family transcriptional regulator, regulator of cefoperazone and chloramphenicol sensitivity
MSFELSSLERVRRRAAARAIRERKNSIRACYGSASWKTNRSFRSLHASGRSTTAIHLYSVLAMGSIYGTSDRPQQDLTARARIRDAALDQFAKHGFEGATVRGIAETAGVSPGLVQHHFGSKEGLRRACDDAVLELVQRKMHAYEEGELSNPSFLGALYTAAPPLVRYVVRAIVETSPAATALLDELVARSEAFLTTTWPDRFPMGSQRTRDAAVVLVAQSAGTMVLHRHVARVMGIDPWKDIVSPRIGLAQLDVYETIGQLAASGWGQEMRAAVATYQAQAAKEQDHG